jgi:hypothetical protein
MIQNTKDPRIDTERTLHADSKKLRYKGCHYLAENPFTRENY